MEENNFVGPRRYKKTSIEGVVLSKPKKYSGKDNGWMSEPVDFPELSSFLGYRFEPKSIHMFTAPKGVIRGGHLESRSKTLTVAVGLAFVVLVDMRVGKNQGKVLQVFLGEGKESWGNTVLIPEGVLAGMTMMKDNCLVYAAADRPFNSFDSELTLDLFDPKLKIEWPRGVKHQDVKNEKEILTLEEFLQKI